MNSAIDFLARLVEMGKWDDAKVTSFRQNLHNVLCSHYQDHWFPEKPFKGSAYRCVRIVGQKMDPLIKKAGEGCGLSVSDLLRVLPNELTMWIDPEEVSYRIGEDGSIGVLYDSVNGNTDSFSSSSIDSTPSSSTSDLEIDRQTPSPDLVMQSCKDQSRGHPMSSTYFPSVSHPQESMPFDRYLMASFVAS